jgi:hypothetical protein
MFIQNICLPLLHSNMIVYILGSFENKKKARLVCNFCNRKTWDIRRARWPGEVTRDKSGGETYAGRGKKELYAGVERRARG